MCEIETDTQRHTERQRERDERNTERQGDRDTERGRETDIQRQRQRQRHSVTEREKGVFFTSLVESGLGLRVRREACMIPHSLLPQETQRAEHEGQGEREQRQRQI